MLSQLKTTTSTSYTFVNVEIKSKLPTRKANQSNNFVNATSKTRQRRLLLHCRGQQMAGKTRLATDITGFLPSRWISNDIEYGFETLKRPRCKQISLKSCFQAEFWIKHEWLMSIFDFDLNKRSHLPFCSFLTNKALPCEVNLEWTTCHILLPTKQSKIMPTVMKL